MEEIKNWWGVFGLFACATVPFELTGASLSPTRISHYLDQREKVDLIAHSMEIQITCGPLNKISCFKYHDLKQDLVLSAQPFPVEVLVDLISHGSYAKCECLC